METILDRDEKWYMKSLDVIRKAIKKKKLDAGLGQFLAMGVTDRYLDYIQLKEKVKAYSN